MKDFLEKLRLAGRLAIAAVLVVLRTRVLRRKLMFFVSVAAMLLTFCGVVILDGFLSEHVWLFLAYWFLTGGLVLFMLLLALYDMLRVKAELSEGAFKDFKDLEAALKEIRKDDDSRD